MSSEEKQPCPECEGTGVMSARNCSSCGGSGEIIVHSHRHRHGQTVHDHPHPHAEPHDPEDLVDHSGHHESLEPGE